MLGRAGRGGRTTGGGLCWTAQAMVGVDYVGLRRPWGSDYVGLRWPRGSDDGVRLCWTTLAMGVGLYWTRHVSKAYGYVRVRVLLAFMVSVAVRELGALRDPVYKQLASNARPLTFLRVTSSYGYGYPYGVWRCASVQSSAWFSLILNELLPQFYGRLRGVRTATASP